MRFNYGKKALATVGLVALMGCAARQEVPCAGVVAAVETDDPRFEYRSDGCEPRREQIIAQSKPDIFSTYCDQGYQLEFYQQTDAIDGTVIKTYLVVCRPDEERCEESAVRDFPHTNWHPDIIIPSFEKGSPYKLRAQTDFDDAKKVLFPEHKEQKYFGTNEKQKP